MATKDLKAAHSRGTKLDVPASKSRAFLILPSSKAKVTPFVQVEREGLLESKEKNSMEGVASN